MSNSLPILAASVGGIPEIFSDGKEGEFWQLDDVAGAADRVCEIMENKALYEVLPRNAGERFMNHFSAEALGNQWIQELTVV